MNTTETETPTAKPEAKQWQSNVGPRLTKTVGEALSSINSQHGYYTEKTGIKGVSERTWGYHVMFGGRREDVAAAWTALGEKYAWTITRENMAAIIAEATATAKALQASAPCVDKTITAEEDARLVAQRATAEQDREAKDRQAKQDREAATADVRRKYPWAVQSGSPYARGAANLKRLLGEAFPGSVFSVKSSSYSMGNSIDVGWTDGPTSKEVDAISDDFETSRREYSGGDPITLPHSTGFTDWMGGAKHVSSSRTMSDEMEIAIASAVCHAFGSALPEGWPKVSRWEARVGQGNYILMDEVNRLFNQASFPAGAVFTGLDTADKTSDQWVVLFCTPQGPPVSTATAETVSASGNRVVRNFKKDGVEIWFADKPSEQKLEECRAAGFRPSKHGGWHWYKKFGAYAWAKAHTLAGVELPATSGGEDRHDMAVEDQMAEVAGVGGLGPRD